VAQMTDETRKRPLVAIDGPAGAGKGAVSALLAERFGFTLIETGAIYRAVALVAMREGLAPTDERVIADRARRLAIAFRWEGRQNRVSIAGEDVTVALRDEKVGKAASRVAALPTVRRALLEIQRRLGRAGGAIAEGRDIGTVVFPDADVKFYLTADERERARRRMLQLRESNVVADEEEILATIQARDRADRERAVAPLKVAPGAIVVDSTAMTLEDVVEAMAREISRQSNRTESAAAPED
jgi:CMP/dCMP kinase